MLFKISNVTANVDHEIMPYVNILEGPNDTSSTPNKCLPGEDTLKDGPCVPCPQVSKTHTRAQKQRQQLQTNESSFLQ